MQMQLKQEQNLRKRKSQKLIRYELHAKQYVVGTKLTWFGTGLINLWSTCLGNWWHNQLYSVFSKCSAKIYADKQMRHHWLNHKFERETYKIAQPSGPAMSGPCTPAWKTELGRTANMDSGIKEAGMDYSDICSLCSSSTSANDSLCAAWMQSQCGSHMAQAITGGISEGPALPVIFVFEG
jgi:hypothetical protein